MAEFTAPRWDRPLDLAERLAKMPPEAAVRGLMFKTAIRAARARAGRAPGREDYSPLSKYPLKELVQVLAECAGLAHPDVSPREGLRRLGREVFPAIIDNPAGRFMFAVAGRDLKAATRLVGRAYSLFSTATARLAQETDKSVTIELRDAWTFPDAYQVGVFEGAMAYYHRQGEVRILIHSLKDADFELRWP